MAAARTALRVAAITAALGLVGACLPGRAADPSTSGPPKGAQQLTAAQARAALPTEEQLPVDLEVDADETEGSELDPEATAYPTTCLDVQLGGEEGTALDEHEVAEAYQGYESEYGGVVSVRVISHDIRVPETLFEAAGRAQGSCAEFTKIDGDGTTTWKLEPATMPLLGDHTYTVGLEMLSGDELFVGGTVRLAGVAVGHNLVYIVYSAGPASSLSPEAVTDLAEATVKNLEGV